MAIDLTTYDTIMLNVFEPAIVETMIEDVSQWRRFSTRPGNWEGRRHYFTYRDQRNEAIYAGSEGGVLPTSGQADFTQHYATCKYHYATMTITGQAIHIAKKGPGALLSALDDAVSDIVKSYTIDLNRVFWGHGSGKLAQISVAIDLDVDQTVTVDSMGGTRWINPGMRLVAYSGATFQCDLTVDEDGKTTTTFEAVESSTEAAADDSYLYRGEDTTNNSKDKEMMGLEGIIDDGTYVATFQGLARASYDPMNAYVLSNSGTGRALTESLLMQAISASYERANGNIDLIIMHPKIIRAHQESLISADRVFMVAPDGTPSYQGGYQLDNFYFGNRRVEQDRDAPWDRVYMAQKDTIKFYYAGNGPVGWINDDKMILRAVAGYDKITGHLRTYGELGCDDPKKNVLIEDISYTANDFVENR